MVEEWPQRGCSSSKKFCNWNGYLERVYLDGWKPVGNRNGSISPFYALAQKCFYWNNRVVFYGYELVQGSLSHFLLAHDYIEYLSIRSSYITVYHFRRLPRNYYR